MILKLTIKIIFIIAEVFLAFYSFVMSDSLLVKFIFFAFTAVIIAFALTKITNKFLPVDKDYIPETEDDESDFTESK